MATLKVTVGGTEPVAIQWYEDGVPMAGQTTNTITNADPAREYYVVATNACGTATSAPVMGDGSLPT